MPTPNLNQLDLPIGPYRDKRVVTIGSDDFELASGFTCAAGADGTVDYRTLEGDEDQTETLAAGAAITGPGGIPVILRAVRGTSTAASIIIGII